MELTSKTVTSKARFFDRGIDLALFNDLKLGKDKRGNVKILYLGKALLVLNVNVAFEIFKDYSTKAFLRKVAKLVAPEAVTDDSMSKAIIIESAYTKLKRKFYKRNNIKNIVKTTTEFRYFIKVAEIIEEYDVTPLQYLEAQVNGLSFADNGKGTFPKPNQLANDNAVTRLLDFQRDDEVVNGENFIPEKLTYDDKNTPVMENPRFVRNYKRVQDDTATLKEATFCHDVMMVVRSKSSRLVVDYIDSFSEEDND